MKKLILLALTIVIMLGCSNENIKVPQLDKDIDVIKIDSCEYITSHVYYGNVIIHKQDCKYCAKRRNQELMELIKEFKNYK